MIDQVYRRETCRLCGSADLAVGVPLAATPLGDDFIPAERLEEVQPTYDLDIMVCGECGHAQLISVVSPEAIYEEYVYTTSVSIGLREHFDRYAEDVLSRIAPGAGSLVVEIGSNEGALLDAFQRRGLRVLGVDPAKEIARRACEAGVHTIGDYFCRSLAGRILEEHGKAAIVAANNVYANLDDLEDITSGIRDLLAPDGVFVFETSYFLDVVDKGLLDTVFHEHLSYFSVRPMRDFFARHGMEMIDVARVPTKGGSIRGTVQLAGGPRPVGDSIAASVAAEESAGIHTRSGLEAFTSRLERMKRDLHDVFDPAIAEGASVAGYGAAVGLTTLIYEFGLGETLGFLADDNPAKQGRFSPGYHIPVLPSDALLERRPDYVVVLAWRYADPIAARNQAYLDGGGKFIVPMPELRIVEAGGI